MLLLTENDIKTIKDKHPKQQTALWELENGGLFDIEHLNFLLLLLYENAKIIS